MTCLILTAVGLLVLGAAYVAAMFWTIHTSNDPTGDDYPISRHMHPQTKDRAMFDRNFIDHSADSTPLPQHYGFTSALDAAEKARCALLAGLLYGVLIGVLLGAAIAWVAM